MSLGRFSQVTEQLNREDGVVRVFSHNKGYAKQLWRDCDRNIRALWYKLDAGKRDAFVRAYFGPDAEEEFHHTMTLLNWIYSKLNKPLFDSECAIYIASPQHADEIWAEYAHNRGFDALWLCRRALPPEAVQALRKLANPKY